MDRLTKMQMIDYKVKSAVNTWRISLDQIELFERTVSDYTTLLDGEQTLFGIGESSLFLLNSRERSLIDAQLKLIDFRRDNQVAKHLVERREFAVLDVVEALGPLSQPNLLETAERESKVVSRRGAVGTTGAVIAPVAQKRE